MKRISTVKAHVQPSDFGWVYTPSYKGNDIRWKINFVFTIVTVVI